MMVANLGAYAKRGRRNPRWKRETYESYRANGGTLDMKRWARKRLGDAVRRGHMQKGICCECLTDQNIEAHHHDYRKPYDVLWLCARHHLELERGPMPVDNSEPL